jgi:pilus assembly protein FimV
MDFGSATVALESPARLDAPNLTLDPNSLSFTAAPPKAAAAPTPAAAAEPAAEAGMIEFDLGALSLDLPGEPTAAALASSELDTDEVQVSTQGESLISTGFDDAGGDPLITKLALAQEFNAIGDPDGARSLAQEVLAEASGDLKNRAQRFLAEIS